MQQVVEAASRHGIRIILDYHRMQPTFPPLYGPEPGLWFDAQNPITDWLGNWQMIATKFKGQTTVVGVRGTEYDLIRIRSDSIRIESDLI